MPSLQLITPVTWRVHTFRPTTKPQVMSSHCAHVFVHGPYLSTHGGFAAAVRHQQKRPEGRL